MGNWITLTAEDLRDYLSSEELDALACEALGEDQENPLPAILADVVKLVRGSVAAHCANVSDPEAGTIPPELKGAAAALVIEAAYARLPGLTLSADRVRLANAARSLLTHVAEGKVEVTGGVTASSSGDTGTASGVKVVLLAARKNTITGASLRGL
jgi:hypothetical protein